MKTLLIIFVVTFCLVAEAKNRSASLPRGKTLPKDIVVIRVGGNGKIPECSSLPTRMSLSNKVSGGELRKHIKTLASCLNATAKAQEEADAKYKRSRKNANAWYARYSTLSKKTKGCKKK